ncbi:TPA: hypothetical protein ACF2DE_002957 [Clostridium perfringens]
MLVTKSVKGTLSRNSNSVRKARKRKVNINYGEIFKFIIYAFLSGQAGIILGFLFHVIY